MTRDQALAVASGLLSSRPMKTRIEAHLGYGMVPSIEDFRSHKAESFDRCRAFLELFEAALEALWQVHESRPRQAEIPMGEEEPRDLPEASGPELALQPPALGDRNYAAKPGRRRKKKGAAAPASGGFADDVERREPDGAWRPANQP
jgi:hypothetical protein